MAVLIANVTSLSDTPGMLYFVLKPGSQHWELCIPHKSDNHFNVGHISVW